MFSKKTIYVHYGNVQFDKNKFEKVENFNDFSKPVNGGLWASPENAEEGWEKIKIQGLQYRHIFKFKLADSAKKLILINEESFEGLPRLTSKSKDGSVALDFEKLSEQIDVICYEYNDVTDRLLPNWDCDCILVMNIDVIEPLE